jgi:hypothetical protein
MDSLPEQLKDNLEVSGTAIDYVIPPTRKHLIVRREHLVKQATGGVEYTPGQTITFDIPASDRGFIANEHYFTVRVLTTGTNKIGGSVKNLLKSVKIMNINGEVLEEYDQVGVIEKIIRLAHMDQDYQYDVLAVEGVYKSYTDQDTTGNNLYVGATATEVKVNNDGNAFGANSVTTKKDSEYKTDGIQANMVAGNGALFCFQLQSSGLLMSRKHIPLQYVGGLRIEFVLESANIALSQGNAYTVKFPRLHYVLADYSSKVKKALSEAHRSGKLHMYYDTWNVRSLTGREETDINVEINKPVLMLKNIFAVMRTTASLTEENKDSFVFYSPFPTNNDETTKYQFIHNDIRYPSQQVNTVKQAYMEYLKATKQLGSVDRDVIPFRDYVAGREFLICNDFEMYPESDSFTGSSTKSNKGVVFEFSRAGDTNIRVDFCSHYTRVASLLSDGTLKISE